MVKEYLMPVLGNYDIYEPHLLALFENKIFYYYDDNIIDAEKSDRSNIIGLYTALLS